MRVGSSVLGIAALCVVSYQSLHNTDAACRAAIDVADHARCAGLYYMGGQETHAKYHELQAEFSSKNNGCARRGINTGLGKVLYEARQKMMEAKGIGPFDIAFGNNIDPNAVAALDRLKEANIIAEMFVEECQFMGKDMDRV